ncbi:acyl-CoA N-acyltransferase [Pholiota conissans]|uniref:Acyl-CoA N-acyltransferase n=1 Tax=Pholiota conissans TaxID=109636 RepID=A0A9P5Z5Y5_9AGAR|nr:acyl-CoA N-acyltransferase [Pholiota conissans]
MSLPSEPYDVNFCFPVPDRLESERVVLTPFVPSKHAQEFVDQALLYPEIFKYLPFGPFSSLTDFLSNLIDSRVTPDPGYILFAIYDKTRPSGDSEVESKSKSESESKHPEGALAGLIGLINSSPANLVTEIGCVMILPPFQRTHVASNAVGLLLHYALNSKSPSPSLGLRKVVWQANALNKPSVRLAERMGFRLEGILKWDRVLPQGKDNAGNGGALREGDPMHGCVGRDTALLSLCWDEWEEGARERVDEIMRRVK